MLKSLSPLLLVVPMIGATSCQSSQSGAATSTPTTEATAPAISGALTETAAREAVARYVQEQPNAGLYQLDSARIINVDTHWQVLVPRTDWAKRMPNAAAFEVDKQSGKVTTLLVK